MVSSIVGNYLIAKGLITKEQFNDLLTQQQRTRVKLGLIAVAEGLMSQDEAEKVNRLQAVMDKRFGDIAVEKGYLTEEQVEALLKKQSNAYLAFAQALEDHQLMTVEQLEQYMLDYRFDNGLMASDIEAIKSDDVDRILSIFLPVGSDKFLEVAGTAIRTMMRCVDTEIYPDRAYVTMGIGAENAAIQKMEGNPSITCGMAGRENELLYVASVFGREKFSEVNEDALDSIGELLNCINGLYASAASLKGVPLELFPPEYGQDIMKIESMEMLVIPLYVKGNRMNFLISVGHEMKMD